MNSLLPSLKDQLQQAMRLNSGLPNPVPLSQVAPEDDDLLSSLAGGGLSALGWIGRTLDKTFGGATLRSLLGGQDLGSSLEHLIPFSDTLGITKGDTVPSGRQLLENAGVLDPKEPNDGFDLGDLAGIATEIATDPATWISGGTTALAKSATGQVASKALGEAGLLDALTERAGSTLTKGWRQGAITKTLGDVLSAAPEARGAMETAAGGSQALDTLLAANEPLGGLTRVHLPFAPSIGVNVGTGDTGAKLASYLDQLGESLRYSGPGRVAASLFSYPSRGVLSKEGQLARQATTADTSEAVAGAIGELLPHIRKFDEAGLAGPEGSRMLNDVFEGLGQLPAEHAALQPSVDAVKQILGKMPADYKDLGLNLKEWESQWTDYLARQAVPGEKSFKGGRAFPTSDQFQMGRMESFDVPGGKNMLNTMSMDPMISGPKRLAADDADALAHIQQTYGIADEKQAKSLAGYFNQLGPKHAEGTPLFPNHPLADTLERVKAAAKTKAATEGAYKFLGDYLTPAGSDFETTALKDVLDKMGLKPSQSETVLQEVSHEPVAPKSAADLPDAAAANSTTWYHGSKAKGLKADQVSSTFSKIENLFGSGVYLTDSPQVGSSYFKGKSGGLGDLYAVKTNVRNVLNLEQPLPPDAVNAIVSASYHELRPEIAAIAAEPGITGAEFWKKMTTAVEDFSHDANLPSSEFTDMFQGIEGNLRDSGYDALTHLGGTRAGRGDKLHRVLVLLDPRDEFGHTGRAPYPNSVVDVQPYAKPGAIQKTVTEPTAAIKQLAAKFGVSPEDVVNFRVPNDIAADATRMVKTFQTPDAVKVVLGKLDKFEQWFKTWVTAPFPGFHVRNKMTGMVSDLIGGINPSELAANHIDATKLLAGDTIKGIAKSVPTFAGMTDEEATKALAELTAKHGLYRGGQIARDIAPEAQSVANIIPGIVPSTLGTAAKALLPDVAQGIESDGTLLGKVKGVLPHPAKAGLAAGNIVEDGNRIASFLGLMKQGWDEYAAAAKSKVMHGDYSSLTDFEKSVMKRLVPFYCVPVDHEILTAEGWKNVDQLRIGERVMSMNHDNGTMEWVPLEGFRTFDFDGDLISYGRSRRGNTKEFLFTEDHRWPIKRQSGRNDYRYSTYAKHGACVREGRRTFVLGKDLKFGNRLIATGDFVSGDESLLTPRLAAILGWVVTDGYHRWRGKHCEMIVYQSPKKYLLELIDLLGTKPRRPHPQTGVVCVPVAHADMDQLRKVFRSKHDLPSIVGRLSRAAAESMWDAMFKAEGCTNPSTGQQSFGQEGPNRKSVLDAFQMLCYMTGKAANLSQRGCYIKKCKYYQVNRKHMSRKRFCGKVWCPTTKHGTWVMRHNGDVVVTGNSFNRLVVPNFVKDILQNPGGITAQAVRAENRLRSDAGFIPDQVGQGLAIPLGSDASGNSKFLADSGVLPLENLNDLFKPGHTLLDTARRTGEAILGQSNPLLKGPLELMTGKQFYTDRDLRDLKTHFGAPPLIEQLVMNSPAARVLSTTSKLADDRKGLGERALNVLTGARTTDVNIEQSKDIAARHGIEELLRGETGVTTHPGDIYIDKATLETMGPEEQKLYSLYSGIQKRAQQRAKEKKAQAAQAQLTL